jgi:hypothetical protein
VEPHHGVNMTGPSLTDLAHWALESSAVGSARPSTSTQ